MVEGERWRGRLGSKSRLVRGREPFEFDELTLLDAPDADRPETRTGQVHLGHESVVRRLGLARGGRCPGEAKRGLGSGRWTWVWATRFDSIVVAASRSRGAGGVGRADGLITPTLPTVRGVGQGVGMCGFADFFFAKRGSPLERWLSRLITVRRGVDCDPGVPTRTYRLEAAGQ